MVYVSENNTDVSFLRIIVLFVIIPVYLLSSIIVNRVIFIIISSQYFMAKGFSQPLALEQAQISMMVIELQTILCLLDTLLMFLLVFLLITKVEKRDFHWSDLGLPLNSTSIKYFIIGLSLGALFTVITIIAGLIQGLIQFHPLKIDVTFNLVNVKFMILFFVWAMLNGFWQELVFRGYLQTRVVEKFNPTVGILTVTIYFVLIHFIDQTLTLRWVILGTLLFIIISMMFHQTKSLWLVGGIHGMINYLDPVAELIGFEWLFPNANYWITDLVILGLALGIYIFSYYLSDKREKGQESG
ncbi:MAG: CPBP family intramembrane metalloprotease [Candidatus Heimdallarchaeota archaeon]|nr:CPBP family intramembrane metalloprotease [Candidatus Heimdallarchaeota archaeon]